MRDAKWFDNAKVGNDLLEAQAHLKVGMCLMMGDTGGVERGMEMLGKIILAKYLVFGCLRYLDEPTLRMLREKNPELDALYGELLNDGEKKENIGGFFG